MTQKLYIVTGASRGMGEAIARQLLAPEHLVIGIARRTSAALQAAAAPGWLQQWQHDLAEPLAAAEVLQQWLGAQDGDSYGEAVLINNAGIITPPGPVDGVPLAELAAALRVGLEASLLLSSAFLRATAGWNAQRKILNISSGLGRRAMAGSAPYCGAKAGMDNLSRAMALDEQHRTNGARIVSLAPGVIDTEMQGQLRAGDPAGFPDQGNFAALKREGRLDSPEQAAAKVLAYLNRPDFGSTVLADVRDT